MTAAKKACLFACDQLTLNLIYFSFRVVFADAQMVPIND
jgi:hypothetical protein